MKGKGILKYAILLVVAAIIYAVVKSQSGVKEVNWATTYDNRHTLPYGTKAVYESLPELFKAEVKTVREPIYNHLKGTFSGYDGAGKRDEEYYYDEENSYTDPTVQHIMDSIQRVQDSIRVANGDSTVTDSSASTPEEDKTHGEGVTEGDNDNGFNNQFKPKQFTAVEDYLNQTQKAPYTSYIIIDQWLHFNSSDERSLLNYVGRGNTAFIAATSFSTSMEQRLKFNVTFNFTAGSLSNKVFNRLTLTDSTFKQRSFTMADMEDFHFFSEIDTANTTVLGADNNEKPNLIKIKYGNGFFIISSCPKAFTNYHFLDTLGGHNYAAAVFSYLPENNTVYWDQYYKQGREGSSNTLRVLLQNDSGRLALYSILALTILYVVFIGKRTQRIIAVLQPFKNSTVEFTETVGRLYYQKANHRNLALKKYYHLLDYVRSNFFMATREVNREFSDTLAAKTGYSPQKMWMIFSAFESIRQRDSISEEELIIFNDNIEKFYYHIKSNNLKRDLIF